jgi:hypothetical protein
MLSFEKLPLRNKEEIMIPIEPRVKRRRFLIQSSALGAALLSSPFLQVRADAVSYSSVFGCSAESSQLLANHHHDWSESTHDARWKMISTDRGVFTTQNTYSSLRVSDLRDGKQLFSVPVPALTHLWISQDSHFIVGISNIKLWNPIQVVVFNSRGNRLLAQQVQSSSFAGVSESTSNWVNWYKEPMPKISLSPSQDGYTLLIEGNNGEPRRFKFRELPL